MGSAGVCSSRLARGRGLQALSQPRGQPVQGWFEREITRQALLVRDALLADRRKPFTNAETVTSWNNALRFARYRGAYVACSVGTTLDPAHAGDDCTPPPDDGSAALPARLLMRDLAGTRGARANRQCPDARNSGGRCTPIPDDADASVPGRIRAPGARGSSPTVNPPAAPPKARRR